MIDINELRFAAAKSTRDLALLPSEVNELLDRLEAVEKERDELRAMIEAVHSILDNDESRIIRNAKDGYPEGREPKELTLTERVTALCKYAADWKRWLGESESKIKEMERQEPTHWSCNVLQADASWKEEVGREIPPDGYYSIRDIKPLYALPGAKGDEK